MAVRTPDEIMESIRSRIGEDTSDEALAFIEDVTDTLNDYETRVKGDGTDWKAKYESNDAEWRQKYKDRFFGNGSDNIGTEDVVIDYKEVNEPTKFEELFTTK